MIRTKLAAVAAAAMLLAYASPADAQRYSFDFGVNGGYSVYTSSLTSEDIGTEYGDIKFSNGGLLGSQLTFWGMPRLIGSRMGLRANMTVTDRPWVQSTDDATNTDLFGHVNLWSGTADLMFGFNAPRETWSGFEFLPYLALGAGLKWINPAGDIFTITDAEEGKSWAGVPATCDALGRCRGAGGTQPGTTRGFALGENGRFLALVGLGGDARFAPNIALRLEVGDRMWKAPIYQLQTPAAITTTAGTIINDTEVGDMIHELYGQVGVHMLFGLSAPPPVAVVAPAPPPVVTAPTPPPAPREDAIRVCVIDPNGEIRMVDATFLPASGDTLVTVNGQRVALRSTTGNVMVATNASWFVQGQPLNLRLGTEQAGFVTFGSSRIVAAEDLAFLGTSNGVPVYADEEDVGDVMSELREMRRARANNDLTDILDEEEDIREELAELKVLYVPLQPTGCVFQPLQRQEQVRKVRG